MNGIFKKVLGTLGVISVGTAISGGVSYYITNKFVKTALERDLPSGMKNRSAKISGMKINDKRFEVIEENSKHLEALEFEYIEIETDDGEKLVGHFYKCENEKRIIVAMHGWRSSWSKDFGGIADFWHKNNCSVLYAEQRGQNNSGGEYMGFGMLERHDCQKWINWVSERFGGEKSIYLAGLSMGATTVLMTAGLELPQNVCGIMADCGYTSAHEIWKHVAENNLHLSYGLLGKIANDICKRKINLGTNDYSTIEAMEQNSIPVLFIHGTADKFVPVEMTYRNYEACKAPKRLLIVPGAEHGMSYFIEPERYKKAVVDFWEDFDRA